MNGRLPGRRGAGSLAAGDAGAVAAGCAPAAAAAAEVLAAGGNAVDAAVAGSAVQCVVEFPWCGVGGDLFLMVHREGAGTVALNGSGAAPARPGPGLTGLDRVPRFGPLSVAVPGLPLAWERALERFGSLPPARLLAPAVALADGGFPVDAALVAAFTAVGPQLGESPHLAAFLAGTGTAPGETLRQPDLARTLATLGERGAGWFYRGEFARAAVAHLRERGGLLDADDLAAHDAEWVAPLEIDYRGHRVLQHPPVSLGALMLSELRLVEQFDLAGRAPDDAGLVDLMVRCKIAAFADGLGSPEAGGPRPISTERSRWWRDRLAPTAPLATAGLPGGSDTTCLAVTDRSGTTATVIHSLFNTLGSRELVPGTGVVLNDRLAGLRVGPGTGPALVPGGRPLHTLNAFMALRGDRVVMAGPPPRPRAGADQLPGARAPPRPRARPAGRRRAPALAARQPAHPRRRRAAAPGARDAGRARRRARRDRPPRPAGRTGRGRHVRQLDRRRPHPCGHAVRRRRRPPRLRRPGLLRPEETP
ncbi:hypothetical protein BJF78_30290 [Pseudonocardia sp. CNS-139]|nr:hypothetical protein BJF78_30290 [Pseudonocardia sp. CNS-139]